MVSETLENMVRDAALLARAAAADLAVRTRADKDAALLAMADALVARSAEVVAANGADVDRAREGGTPESTVDRLRLDDARVAGMASGLRQVAALADPVGEIVRGFTLPNGLQVTQRRVPFGVVGIIYEARPNVTADAAGLALKSGNAVLLRGSSSAAASNAAVVDVLREAVASVGLPADAVQLIRGGREAAKDLMRARGLVDLLIPRGSAGLIRTVVEESTVPVIETGSGNCHLYVDVEADLDMALSILLNSKTQRTSVCNALETMLVHESVADTFLPSAVAALSQAGVTVHGDEQVQAVDSSVVPATDKDWAEEYLSMDLAVGVVPDLDTAVTHIRRWGSGHTESIVTRSLAAAQRFAATTDSAAIMVNASTRFTDGEQFGFGAEIGISTQKLHARGPMALPELTTTTYVVTGDGQIRT